MGRVVGVLIVQGLYPHPCHQLRFPTPPSPPRPRPSRGLKGVEPVSIFLVSRSAPTRSRIDTKVPVETADGTKLLEPREPTD